MERQRVLIVGGGPVGLVAAAFLAAGGIPVTLIEAQHDVAEDLRASTFHPPTLDFLARLGITDRLVEQGLVCRYWQFRDRQEGAVATFDLDGLRDVTAFPYRIQCEQWKLARLLRQKLEESGCAELIYGARALALAQDDDGVALTIEREDGTRDTLAGSYLIGADGARSTIRRELNVGYDG